MSGESGGRLSEDLQAEKAAVRRQIRDIRDAVPVGERAEMAKRAEERLFSLPEVRDAKTVVVFYSFGSEIRTQEMIKRFLDGGRRVLLPYMESGEMLTAEVRPGDSLVPTPYGPKEPAERAPADPLDVDVVIAPGLAFDRSGHRIGYGGGNYDRYLARLRRDATRVGIAFNVQVLPAVPHGPEDQPVDYVVTDREIIRR